MAQIKFSNNATTTIALAITEVDTTLTVKVGDGAKFPTLTGDDYFIGTLVRGDGGTEIVKVTARTSDTMTIERAQEGSTALAFSANDIFELRLTAGSLETVINIPDASEAVKGLTQFATEAEVEAVTEDAKAISPLNFGTYMANRTVATPSFSMPASAAEKTVVSGTYAVEVGATAAWSVPTAFVDFNDAGDGTFTFTAPTLDVDTSYDISMTANKTGKLTSQAVVHSINITNVPVQDGPTIVVADTTEGWPGATISGGDIVAPATSTGTNNTYQFVTAKPEVIQTSGNLNISTSSATSITVNDEVTQGDTLVTDQGTAVAGTVVESGGTAGSTSETLDVFGDGSCLSLYTFNNTLLDAGTYDRFNLPTGAYVTGKFDQGYTDPANTQNISAVGGTNLVPISGSRTVTYWAKLPTGTVGARAWNLQGGSDASTYTTDIGGLYVPSSGNIQAVLNASSFNSPVFSNTGDWMFYVFESSPSGGGKIYVDNVLLTDSISHIDANYAYRLYQASSSGGEVDQARIFNRVLTEDERTKLFTESSPSYQVDIAAAGFSTAPTTATKATASLKIGYGITDEYLGPEESLTLGAGSTTSSIVLESNTSIKDNIYVTGGIHNNLIVDSIDTSISSVSEVTGEGPTEILTDQGTFISSGTYPGLEGLDPLVLPVDSSDYWGSVEVGPAVVNTSYVGSQFAEDTTVNGFYLRQAGTASTGANSMTSVMVQKSPDGVAWSDVEQITITDLGTNLGQYTLTTPSAGKYWRLLAKVDSLCGACSWAVSYLRWTHVSTLYTTTAVPSATLSGVPAVVSIPDRCNVPAVSYTYSLVGSDAKVTAGKLTLVDDPNIKRLAMRVEGTGTTFDTGRIYTEEQL